MVVSICIFIISVTVIICLLGGKYLDIKRDDISYTRYRDLRKELTEIKIILQNREEDKG